MPQNLRINDVVYPNVPYINIPTEQGGMATFYESGGGGVIVPKTISTNGVYNATDDDADGYSPVTVNVDLETVQEFTPLEIPLSRTDFATWTPSTTAKAILPTAVLGTFTASSMTDHDYFIRQRIFVDIKYKSGTSTAKGMCQLTAAENWYLITRRASTVATLNSQTMNTNVAATVVNIWVMKYYNTSWTMIYSSAYGIYPSNTAPTLSSTTAASPTVTVKSAVINAKCQGTYFSTGMAGNVDQDESTITIKATAYRADIGYMQRTIYHSLADMWNNGL